MNPALPVLGTWLVILAWIVLLGGFAGVVAHPSVGTLGAVRVAMWTGLAVLICTVLALNLFLPLMGTGAIVGVLIVTVISIATGLAALRFTRDSNDSRSVGRLAFNWWVVIPIVALIAYLLVVAHFFAGPVSNYDSGLYHLNSIQFAANYPTIPGLANLHERLGTNVSTFPLAAFLGNTPWGIESFRLLVGLFMGLMSTDVILRLLDRRRSSLRSPGLYVLLLSILLAWPALMVDPGYWLTSPTPDTISMLLTLVAGAYLVDGLTTFEHRPVWSSVALITACLAASVRTQLWVFAFLTALVLAAAVLRRRKSSARSTGPTRALGWIAIGTSAALVVIMMVRDVIISGWLLFPAAALPMPVDWRVPDSTALREWLLSWARSPGASPDVTLANWDWLWPWVGRTSTDWAIRGTVGLLLLAGVIGLLVRGARREVDEPVASLRTVLSGVALPWFLAVVPALGMVIVWFWTAPDPRFAWGAILLVGLVPAASAWVYLDRALIGWLRVTHGAAMIGVVAALMSAVVLPVAASGLVQIRGSVSDNSEIRTYSFGPIDVTAAMTPVPVPALTTFTLPDGRELVAPQGTDQCWMVFPYCRPYADASVRFRGPDVADGMKGID